MRSFSVIMASLATVQALSSLADVCTNSYVTAHLPLNAYAGISINPSSVVASLVYNASIKDATFFPNAVIDYCAVTFSYSHDGLNDSVVVSYWLPSPDKFQKRYLSTGGGGYAINSGNGSLPGGIIYGAVAGKTDAGFGVYQTNALPTFLYANGTRNWHSIYMFGYEAIHEMGVLGKSFTKSFYGMTATSKLYSYYQGCSEGGREGWSQLQRFADEFDGAAIGAPAFRFAFQQVQHLYANVVEQTMNYFPPPCELQAIVNATIIACDPLDGRKDGVVSRTDLCTAQFDVAKTIGTPYNCAATAASPRSGALPAQNGTVSAKAVTLVKKLFEGLHDSHGRRAYFHYTPSSTFTDAQTQWNPTTGKWELAVTSLGGSFVQVLLDLQAGSNLPNLNNVTYDTLVEWINEGWNKYNDVLMTNWPDLTPFKKTGGKVIHFHGESDYSIPAASSVRYWESVREIMNPGKSYKDSVAATNEFYRLFLVPGGSHCAANSGEPNGVWPQTSLANLIDWVEKEVAPVTLNGTVLAGENKGQNQQICGWPLRPLFTNNGAKLSCVYDQKSIDSWKYELDAFAMPVY